MPIALKIVLTGMALVIAFSFVGMFTIDYNLGQQIAKVGCGLGLLTAFVGVILMIWL